MRRLRRGVFRRGTLLDCWVFGRRGGFARPCGLVLRPDSSGGTRPRFVPVTVRVNVCVSLHKGGLLVVVVAGVMRWARRGVVSRGGVMRRRVVAGWRVAVRPVMRVRRGCGLVVPVRRGLVPRGVMPLAGVRVLVCARSTRLVSSVALVPRVFRMGRLVVMLRVLSARLVRLVSFLVLLRLAPASPSGFVWGK